ncbi:MAG: transposase [Lachnospiraceae bacterium]
MFEAMLQGEMNGHMGYENNERSEKGHPNRRNGYSSKTLKTTAGNIKIQIPRQYHPCK